MGDNPQDNNQAPATNDLKIGSTPADQAVPAPTSKSQSAGASYYQPVDGVAPEPVSPTTNPTPSPSPSPVNIPPATPASTTPPQPTQPAAVNEPVIDNKPKQKPLPPTMGVSIPPAAPESASPAAAPAPSATPAPEPPVNAEAQVTSPSVTSTPPADNSQDVVEKMQAANKPSKANPLSGLLHSKVGKIALGLIVVLVVVMVGWSTYNQLFNQSTTNSLPSTNQQLNTGTNSKTNSAGTAMAKPFISGEVCSGTAGRLYFYSLNEQKVYSKQLPAGQTMFRADVPAGNYQVIYETGGTNLQMGATNNNHDLTVLNVTAEGLTAVEVCDDQMNQDSVPQGSFAYGGEL